MTNQKQYQLNNSTIISKEQKQQDLSEQLALTIAEAADARKAEEIVILRVAEISYMTDYLVIATGYSKTQVRAICNSIEEKVASLWEKQPLHTEGKAEGSWILQDYGDVIVHIFLPQEREFYNLEAFWGHAKKIEFKSF